MRTRETIQKQFLESKFTSTERYIFLELLLDIRDLLTPTKPMTKGEQEAYIKKVTGISFN